MDICDWLEQNGLGKYAEVFAENEIDLFTLPELTEDDLREMGLPIGPRRRLLKAARNSVEPDATNGHGEKPKVRTVDAERRQITVMFCDLVGSTALSRELDPEDLRAVMADYQAAAGAVIERHEGHVAQFLGDGLMVYFGWPQAHEDDAGRAVRASLEIVETIKGLAAPVSLHVRVGIATGPVVVGATGGGDASIPVAAVGETPNLAARLQELAKPDEIVISPTTQRLARGEFDYADLGGQVFKGIVEPVQAWRVIRASDIDGPFAARNTDRLTSLVGRDSEVALLLERWGQAKDGEGQVVLLSGEPGIGKSRIAQAFGDRVAHEPHTRLRYQCSPYYTNTALYPFIDQLERASGFKREDTPDTRLDKVELLLAQGTENVAEAAPLFAALLSLPTERYTVSSLNPEQQKQRTFGVLTEQACGLARQNPVLMIFEDAHWADPTTLELLNSLVEQIQDEAMLLIVTCRPEFASIWGDYSHVTWHSLNRLSRRQRAQMVAELSEGATLPDEVIDQIIARTDGVPLFVEELTKAIMESRLADDLGGLSTPETTGSIPATLQDSLMARLDRLETGKEIAQIGACIGREFGYELLRGVSSLAEDELQAGLQKLAQVGLVNQRGLPPQSRYVFKHALIQDTAYQSLLKTARHTLHGRIAQQLEQHFSDTVENEPELLALHYTGAGLADQAISYWQKAGQRAVERSANVEAVEHLRNGLELVAHLADAEDQTRRELTLRAQLGPALIAVKGYGARETADCYDRAREILESFDDSPAMFPILYGCWVNKVTWAEFVAARDMAEQFLSRAIERDDTAAILTGYRISGFSQSCLGEFTMARESFNKLLVLYQTDQHASLTYQYGQDPKAAGASMLGWNLWHLGYPDQAVQVCDGAVDYARDLEHTNTRGYVETFGAARIHLFRGDRESVDYYVKSMLTLCEKQNLVFWLGFVKTFEGWSLIEQDEYEEAIETIKQGLAAHDEIHTLMFKPHTYAILAQAYVGCERLDESNRALDEAIAIADRTNEHWITPELYRLKGEMMLQASNKRDVTSEAKSCFEHSLSIARRRAARGWELRAATSLARLWQREGNIAKARELLFDTYSWFTEGFDTKDLRDAKTVLEQLA